MAVELVDVAEPLRLLALNAAKTKWVLETLRASGRSKGLWKRYKNGKGFLFAELTLVRAEDVGPISRFARKTPPTPQQFARKTPPTPQQFARKTPPTPQQFARKTPPTPQQFTGEALKSKAPVLCEPSVKFLSWNCFHLSRKTARQKKAIERMVEVINTADFVALQEVDDLEVVPGSIMPLLPPDWGFVQAQITGRRRRLECYVFLYRLSKFEVVSRKKDLSTLSYIVQQDGVSSAFSWFHRPPMVATFRVKGGFTFTAINIHVTYGGRRGYAPQETAARLLEAGNIAALAAWVQEKHRAVDRVIVMGDFNMHPTTGFHDLVDVLGFKVGVDPLHWASSMTSQAVLNGGRATQAPPAPPKLYDNIFISQHLRQDSGVCIVAGGVLDLRDFTPPDIVGEKTLRTFINETLSDHFPVYVQLVVGERTQYDGPLQMKRVRMQAAIVGDDRIGNPYSSVLV